MQGKESSRMGMTFCLAWAAHFPAYVTHKWWTLDKFPKLGPAWMLREKVSFLGILYPEETVKSSSFILGWELVSNLRKKYLKLWRMLKNWVIRNTWMDALEMTVITIPWIYTTYTTLHFTYIISLILIFNNLSEFVCMWVFREAS